MTETQANPWVKFPKLEEFGGGAVYIEKDDRGRYVALVESILSPDGPTDQDINPRSLDVGLVMALGPQFARLAQELHRLGIGIRVHCTRDTSQQWERVDRLARGEHVD